MEFYSEHRAEFERENPGVPPAELTKIAMNQYKQIYPSKSNGTPNGAGNSDDANKSNGLSAKRKIDTDDNERSSSSVKLARFSFKKQ